MKRPLSLIWCIVAITAGACDSGRNAQLTIFGDTLVHARLMVLDNKGTSAECKTSFAANLSGSEKGSATIVAGRIDYRNPAGQTLTHAKWGAKEIRSLWPDSVIKGGEGRGSVPFGISTSMPMPKIEATATFDYKVDGGDTKTTAPFIFHCY